MTSLQTEIEMRWCELINQQDAVFGETTQELQDIKNLQPAYYQGILDEISRVNISGKSTDLQYWTKCGSVITATLQRTSFSKMARDGINGHAIVSILPIITPEQYREFIDYLKASLNKLGTFERYINVSKFILLGLIVTIKEQIRDFKDPFMDAVIQGEQITLARFQSMSTYIKLHKEGENNIGRTSAELEKLTDSYGSLISNAKMDLDSAVADAQGRLDAVKQEVERLQQMSAGTETRMLAAIKEHDEATKRNKEELEGIATSTIARANLAALGDLWDGLAKRSKKSMWIFGGISVAMLFVGILFLILGRNWIMSFITSLPETGEATDEPAFLSLQISRIVVMTIPLLLYIWGLKIAVRMFIRSMALFDDATQRKTILDSYFFLTEKGRIDKDAQPIVIGAVCRPVPGHGTDGFELPDLAQVLQAGQNYFRK